jgi:hypothetical protein
MRKGTPARKPIMKIQADGSFRPTLLPFGREPVKPLKIQADGSFRPTLLPFGREPVKPLKIQGE